MANINSELVFNGLFTLVNEVLNEADFYLDADDMYKVDFYLWDPSKIKDVIHTFKFENVGNCHDYTDIFPEPEVFTEQDMSIDYDNIGRIAVSNKYNAIIYYDENKYNIRVFCLIDKSHYKQFSKKMTKILTNERSLGIFNSVNFNCKKKEYIEISDILNEEDKYVSVQKLKIPNEKLVFDTNSEIFNVMEDIKLFFKKDTKELYKKMNILYKRGIILHGNPGNGKTAMIREIIRQLSGITTIIINPNTPRVVFVLTELFKALKGRKAMLVIEDIDAVINASNRSEFLNLLDGVNIASGIYFIGTTNYPERIDPAFVNRSGRFDRLYEIPNPSETVRRAFFRSCKLTDILHDYKVHKDNSENNDLSIIDLFVKYSDNLSMANLKELMIATQYMLIVNKGISIEEALEKNYNILTTVKAEHEEAYNNYYNDMGPRYVPKIHKR